MGQGHGLTLVRALCALALLSICICACEDNKGDGSRGGLPDATTTTPDASDEGPGTRTPGTLRVATFNVRRYFDTVCQSQSCGSGAFEEVSSASAFATRTAQIAKGIEKLEADVVALQEIENQTCLDALTAKLKEDGHEFPVAVLGETGAAASVDVAVLARGTLGPVIKHRNDKITRPDGSTTSFTREFLEVHVAFGAGAELVFFAAHFRSKVDDDPGRRLAEASAARDIVTKAQTDNPSAIVVLGGDLNDTPGSDTLTTLEQGGSMVRLAADLSAADQGTYTFNGAKTAIDHLYAPKPSSTKYVAASALVVRDDARGLGGSDHAALRADLGL